MSLAQRRRLKLKTYILLKTHMKNNLILSGLHLNLTDSLKSIVSEKMEKIFKHEERIIRARIELEHDSKSSSHEDEYVAKGHLELKGKTITVSVLSENIYKAVDDLVEKLDRGLRRRSRLSRKTQASQPSRSSTCRLTF